MPLLIGFLILVAVLGGRLWQAAGKWARPAIIAFFALFLVYYAYRTADFTRQMARSGLGYANIGWHNSETVPYIRAHPEMTNLVSTGSTPGSPVHTGQIFVLGGSPQESALQEQKILVVVFN